METESLRYMRKRRAELQERLDELRAQIGPIEFELKQADAAIALMTDVKPSGAEASRNAVAHFTRQQNPQAEHLTIKELVLKVLAEHLPNGATSQQFLEVFAQKWGRTDIRRTSLSPQLTRLKDEGKVVLMGKQWMLPEQFNKQFGGLLDDIGEQLEHDEQVAADWDRVEHPDDNQTNTATDQ